MRTVSIDGDIIVYSCGFAAQEEPLAAALHSANKMVERIVRETGATDYVVYLTGKGNFREEVATIQGYKANRAGQEKPLHYTDIKNHLIKRHKAIVVEGEEADDALGIAQCMSEGQHTIASLDKDLDMIPGWHYNWRKDELYEMTEDEGMRFFYTQLITGDSTDNIPGLFKLTGTKALKKYKEPLEMMDDESFMWDHVYNVYLSAYSTNGMCLDDADTVVRKWLIEIGKLLWIRRYPCEEWMPPVKEDE